MQPEISKIVYLMYDFGAVYIFDESAPFYCLISGFEADMGFARRLETRLIMKDSD